jgi:hypothetical protein
MPNSCPRETTSYFWAQKIRCLRIVLKPSSRMWNLTSGMSGTLVIIHRHDAGVNLRERLNALCKSVVKVAIPQRRGRSCR